MLQKISILNKCCYFELFKESSQNRW